MKTKFETSEIRAQRVLILGYESSGKKTIMRSVSKRKIVPEEGFFTTSAQLECCDKQLTLYSINPNRSSISSLKPILKASTCAIVLVNSSNSQAAKQLESLIQYCNDNGIESITVGICSKKSEHQLFDEESIHQYLLEQKLNLPIVLVHEDNKNDIESLLEVACTKSVVDDDSSGAQ